MTDSTPTLRELFEAALAMAPAQRAEFLDAHCRNAAQRAAVERLLAADEDGGARVLDHPFDELLGSVVAAEPEGVLPPPGSRVGPFTLLDKLGEGGSSIVFRAEREQAGVRQTVALKLLRRGLYSTDEQRRFRSERLALSQLRHPGIARLIEGGVTDAGAPYIALELIDGESITAFVRNGRLDLRRRLSLFVDVCRAVEAAHRALIVHRDLKPSNVLVTRDGEVKLLDFGIAKLLDADPETESEATRTQHPVMTPAYAAPEQFVHGPITTATDVYALGVLLGELVTGRRREHGDTRTPSATIDADTDPAVLPAPLKSVRRQLRGDIDNIVLKATAHEPERRYASAGALADDVERHLEGQPVVAHPPSSWYRAQKFVSRHRGGVATTAAFLLAILAALGIALWQAEIAREQAHIAQEQARRAEAVRDLLVDIFDAEIPSRPRGEMPGTAELLERGAQHATTDLDETPAVQSDLLTALGRVYDHLALPDKGTPVLDAAVAAARRVSPEDPALLGAALSERGEVDLSSDRFAEAIALFEQAIPLQKKTDPDGLPLAITLDRRALAESQTGRHDEAIADYSAALAIRRKRLAPDDADIIDSYDALGNAYVRAGRPDEGIDLLRKAIAGAQAKFGEKHVKTAHYTKNLATILSLQRRYAEAATLTERAVSIERELYPPGSPDVVNGLNNLGNIQLTLGRLAAARDTLDEARKRNRDGGLDESLGQTFVLGNLARVHEALGDTADALALLDEATRTATKVVGPDHARTLTLELQRARVAAMSDPKDAPGLERIASAILEHPDNLKQFRSRSEPEAGYALGLAQAARGDEAASGVTWKRAVDALPADHVDPLTLPLVAALARFEATHGKSDDAAALLHTFINRADRELPPSQYAIGELHLALAQTLAQKQKPEALTQLDAADAAFGELPPDHSSRKSAAALRHQLATP
ncbi:MAG TPA: serine/threonine-protein kinase [Rhodanobacteraceae bacterium]|nr:serine/threonine-protein kinase [Rhodanobacteraceae bacterium]